MFVFRSVRNHSLRAHSVQKENRIEEYAEAVLRAEKALSSARLPFQVVFQVDVDCQTLQEVSCTTHGMGHHLSEFSSTRSTPFRRQALNSNNSPLSSRRPEMASKSTGAKRISVLESNSTRSSPSTTRECLDLTTASQPKRKTTTTSRTRKTIPTSTSQKTRKTTSLTSRTTLPDGLIPSTTRRVRRPVHRSASRLTPRPSCGPSYSVYFDLSCLMWTSFPCGYRMKHSKEAQLGHQALASSEDT